MRDARKHNVGKGLRRRGRLLAEALRPPQRTGGTVPGRVPSHGSPARTRAEGGAKAADDSAPAPKKGEYVAPRATRLVESPVFLLSPVRSGSTLLRVLLNSHTQIRAPHEMHLRTVHVRMSRDFTPKAMRELELDRSELEHLLWDRILHLELERTGKSVVVDKTPANTFVWRRLHESWPDARYLFLLRDPAAIVTSLVNRRQDPDLEQIHTEVTRYTERLEEARQKLDGLTVRYEELTAEPEKVTRSICDHLGVEWEAGMLDYGTHDHGTFRPHIGDWSSNIRSGRIQPARTESGVELPPRLERIAEKWGYRADG
ncbi:sulfotransferase family protein [Streptomyces sp. TR06-5]|uniref:sulfotransferase family protein n=1 Tax=unclassified Streptomyces TaxID=2593676 RepID=UPI0039A15D99